jgi:hypothetical protein
VVTCTRGVNTSESNVFCSYSTWEMEGFVKGKVRCLQACARWRAQGGAVQRAAHGNCHVAPCTPGLMAAAAWWDMQVSTHGQILEGEFYEMYMTLSDSDGPTSVSNGTCVTGSLSWIAIGWPNTFMGHRLVSSLFSALTALGGNEGVVGVESLVFVVTVRVG